MASGPTPHVVMSELYNLHGGGCPRKLAESDAFKNRTEQRPDLQFNLNTPSGIWPRVAGPRYILSELGDIRGGWYSNEA